LPVTPATKDCMPPADTDALVGVMLNDTAGAAATVIIAEADFVGSASDVACTAIVEDVGAVAGAVYNPLEEIDPHPEPLQPVPLKFHVTARLDVPVTFAKNC
jgi:hypothetical protein